MGIIKTVVEIISRAFSLPVGDETANHVNFTLMSRMPIFSCLESDIKMFKKCRQFGSVFRYT